MDGLKVLTIDRLNKLIDETQATLIELKAEVARREHLQQEHEIDELDRHMSSAEFNLASIKQFITYLLEQSKKKEQ